MPKQRAKAVDSTASNPDAGAVIPRIKLGEDGFLGLKTSNHRILEETQAAFRYPAFIKTVNEMRNNPTVGSAMNVYRMMISRVKWDVEAPKGADEKTLARTELVRSDDERYGRLVVAIH
jgi:hypothetical protein